jgi:hypothetical protein
MLRTKWKITALILATSLASTELGRSVHFSFFHIESSHHQTDECGNDCLEGDVVCVYENIHFPPYQISTYSYLPPKPELIQILSSNIFVGIPIIAIVYYRLRGPPFSGHYFI